MKTKIFLTVCALFLIVAAFGQMSTMELTFTATHNDTYIQLDSIRVVNQTQGGDLVLYWPDTVLVLYYTPPQGIAETNGNTEDFQVFQNYPNPVLEKTSITIFIPEKDKVGIIITDILGRMMFSREITLERGYHTFRYLPGVSEICFFSAFWQGNSRSIKILSPGTGSGQRSELEYKGNTLKGAPAKSLESIQSFDYDWGDALQYTGYATIDATIIGSDIKAYTPETDTTYMFDIFKGLRCSGDLTIMDSDSNVYYTLKIGNRCWMAENLKTTKFNDGTEIPFVPDGNEWEFLSTAAYCWFDNNIYYKDIYGAMYNWYTVETGNLCPTGWHVPTDQEWITLVDYLGGEYIAGAKLKEKGTTHWNSNLGATTNETGYTALPGGFRNNVSSYLFTGEYGYWWTATVSSPTEAWYHSMKHNTNGVSSFPMDNRSGNSVRCIKHAW